MHAVFVRGDFLKLFGPDTPTPDFLGANILQTFRLVMHMQIGRLKPLAHRGQNTIIGSLFRSSLFFNLKPARNSNERPLLFPATLLLARCAHVAEATLHTI